MPLKPGALTRANGRFVVLAAIKGDQAVIVPKKASTGRPVPDHRADVTLSDGSIAMCARAFVTRTANLQGTGFSVNAAEIAAIRQAIAREQTSRDLERRGARDDEHSLRAWQNVPGNDRRRD